MFASWSQELVVAISVAILTDTKEEIEVNGGLAFPVDGVQKLAIDVTDLQQVFETTRGSNNMRIYIYIYT